MNNLNEVVDGIHKFIASVDSNLVLGESEVIAEGSRHTLNGVFDFEDSVIDFSAHFRIEVRIVLAGVGGQRVVVD